MVTDERVAPAHDGPSGRWRYHAETDAYYFWDGQRYSIAAQRHGADWVYAKIRSSADRRADAALTSSIISVFLFFFIVPLVVTAGLIWDASRQYRRSGEPVSRTLHVATALAALSLLLLIMLLGV